MSKKKPLKVELLAESLPYKVQPQILCCPPIPMPMHGVCPRIILGEKWWNKTRRLAYKSNNYHCQACGVYKYKAKNRQWMECHELYDIDYLLGKMYFTGTVPLCHYCHNYIHQGRLKWLLDTGKIHQAKFISIIQHGDKIMRDNNLYKDIYIGEQAAYEDWRLVLEGKEYPPLTR